MLRSYLLAYPFAVACVAVLVPLFVPIAWVTGSIRLLYWQARQACRISLRLGGVRIHVLHPDRATIHPCCVFVANHVSNVEAPALFAVLPRIAVIMKEALGHIPLLGYAMRLGGFICVDRKGKDSRKRALEAAVQTLQSGISILIFPEGTRNPSGPLLPFRPGPFQMAIDAGVPVVPITVHGAAVLMPKGKTYLRPGVLTIAFHLPVATKGMGAKDRIELMGQVRAVMQLALDA